MLYSFLVLGYIPGTNIQLSFQAILALEVIMAGTAAIGWIELQRRLFGWANQTIRQPLHASQLHLRVR